MRYPSVKAAVSRDLILFLVWWLCILFNRGYRLYKAYCIVRTVTVTLRKIVGMASLAGWVIELSLVVVVSPSCERAALKR